MKTLAVTTHLAIEPDVVREHVMSPGLLSYVVAGLMKFEPIEPALFPDQWIPGEYKVRMLAFHVIPVGWQCVNIELPEEDDEWCLRDNGCGSVARVWDHRIFIEPDGIGTRYTDSVCIDAGVLTWPVSLYATLFFHYRQRRWRKLVELDFEPLSSEESDGR